LRRGASQNFPTQRAKAQALCAIAVIPQSCFVCNQAHGLEGTTLAATLRMMNGRSAVRYVYLLRSLHDPSQTYVGLTADVPRRLATHNSGGSRATAAHRPWALIVSIEFVDPSRAEDFEQYLKSGAGRAFAKRFLV
jgi:predicted GIY-YIG superfamily endonuclease